MYKNFKKYKMFFKLTCAVVASVAGYGVMSYCSTEFLGQEVPISYAQQSIPKQAIRLRVLAHSDHPADQRIKRQIRDLVIANMKSWAKQPGDMKEARALVQAHLPALAQTVTRALKDTGANYKAKLSLGQANFPDKVYGMKKYPAGKYEALVVTLGAGQGRNWWCVLFPPLCFVDLEESMKQDEVASASTELAAQPVRSSVQARSYFADKACELYAKIVD
ncbi:MAG: hypothetical protein RLZ12_495 [Bacillota bacterium]